MPSDHNLGVIPPEVKRWNWGAFLLSWVWGIGNNTFFALLALVPFLNLVMPFVLGAKGSAWAWRNKQWESVEAFSKVQRKWALWGAGVWVASIVVCSVTLFGVFASLKNSEIYGLAVGSLSASKEAREILGEPIETGIPTGSIEVSNDEGEAHLSFSATGSRGTGTVRIAARKEMGRWVIDREAFDDQATGKRIELLP
jgi:hypothetical protein